MRALITVITCFLALSGCATQRIDGVDTVVYAGPSANEVLNAVSIIRSFP